MLIESFSGIRGVYNEDLTTDIARRYAFVYYQFLKDKLKREPIIVIGTDTRESSNDIKEAMFDSMLNIIDVGVMTTPGIEFAVRSLKADGGIIVTASHNEPEYNGFKFLDNDGAVSRYSKNIINRYNNISELSEEEFLDKLYQGNEPRIKKIKNIDVKQGYFKFLLDIIKKENIELIKKANLRVVMDPVGGPGLIAKELLEQLNVYVIGQNMNPGEFGRKIEPNDISLAYLHKIVEKEEADFAVGFDLDADRMAIMMRNGNIATGNITLALLTDDILSESKNPSGITIVTNDATSSIVKEITKKHGANIKEVEAGEINVVDGMLQNKSPVGGEGSCAGAIYSPSRCRDGILSLLFILKIIAKNKKHLEDLVDSLPEYYNLQKAILFNPKDHDKIKEKLKIHYKKYKQQETGDITGGLKIIFKDNSYVWFRASKTENGKLRIISDSKDKAKAKKILSDALQYLKKITK